MKLKEYVSAYLIAFVASFALLTSCVLTEDASAAVDASAEKTVQATAEATAAFERGELDFEEYQEMVRKLLQQHRDILKEAVEESIESQVNTLTSTSAGAGSGLGLLLGTVLTTLLERRKRKKGEASPPSDP